MRAQNGDGRLHTHRASAEPSPAPAGHPLPAGEGIVPAELGS
jgi:hypothetical protein